MRGVAVRSADGPRAVLAAAFSPDSKRIATGSDDSWVRLWDATTGKQTASFEAAKKVLSSIAFSLDGKTLAAAGADGEVTLRPVAK